MKLSTRSKWEIFLFLCIIIFSFFVVQPTVQSLNSKLLLVREAILVHIENNYHVRLSYEALSPSLFRGIIIRNLKLYDKDNNQEIAYFEELSIRYRFLELLRGNTAAVLHSLYIKNGFINLDLFKNKEFIAQFNSNTQNLLEDTPIPIDQPQKKTIALESFFLAELKPLTIRIKNVQLGITAPQQQLHINIIDGLCTIDTQDITLSLKSTAAYHNTQYPALHNCDSAFTIEGKIQKDLTAGTGAVHFSHVSTKYAGTYNTKLFVNYKDNILTATSMQEMLPFDFNVSWNTQTNVVKGKFSCRDLTPLQNLTLYNVPAFIDQLVPAEITGAADFSFENKHFNWNSQFLFHIPEIITPSFTFVPTTMEILAGGKDQYIEISKLTWQGTGIDIESACAFDINSLLPSGFMKINTFMLPSGTPLSSYIQFAKKGRSILCFIPSIKLAKGSLNSINIQLTPFTKKIDYILSAKDNNGTYSLNGSYIYGNAHTNDFLELHGACDAVSIGNIYQIIKAIHPHTEIPETLIAPLQCTTEFYFSSNLKEFSYNCTRFILVSNEMNDFYMLFSLKGDQRAVAIHDIAVVYKNTMLRGDMKADFATLDDIIFDSSLNINEIGYHFKGFFSENTITIYGDYGLSISVLYDSSVGIKGSIKTTGTPLPISSLFFACDSEFQYTDIKNWNVRIYNGQFYYGTPLSFTQDTARMNFSGSINPRGLFFDDVQLGTSSNLLAGFATATMNAAKNAAHVDITLESADKNEKVELNASLSIHEKLYASGTLNLQNLALYRFLPAQGKNNYISAQATFSGSQDSLSVQLSLPMLSAKIQNNDLTVSSSIFIENEHINLINTNIAWGGHAISSLVADFELLKGIGNISADYSGSFSLPKTDGSFAKNPLKTHINTSFAGTVSEKQKNTQIPIISQITNLFTQFSITALLSDWQISNQSGEAAIPLTIIRDSGVTALYVGNNDEINGFITDDGIVSLHALQPLPLQFNLNGNMKYNELDFNLTDLQASIKTIWDITGMDHVRFYNGELTGTLSITGKIMEPEFSGELKLNNIAVNSPNYIPEIFRTESLCITADGTTIEMPYTILSGPSTDIWAQGTMEFVHWLPDVIKIECGTLGKKKGIVKTNNLLFEAEGLASAAATITISPTKVSIEGEGAFDSGYFAFKVLEMDKFNKRYSGPSDVVFNMKLNLTLGQTAEFRWPSADVPILRAYIPTKAPLTLIVDSESENFSINGNVNMRGGEIFYLKRNFYIREGDLMFMNKGNEIDPMITLRAEARDRDEQGTPIRYILAAKNQSLMDFRPALTSDPPRSSHEIMQLWRNVLAGDIEKDSSLQNLLITGSDILAQIALFKKFENRIRNFLHLDVFSFRSLLLQNAIFGNLFNTGNKSPLSASNYLDNTSVYIGKYFGSAIYADALLQLSGYDDTSLKKGGATGPVYNNILFQPEIGVEMATPFFMLRWSMAPTQIDPALVEDTGLTFSWKYSY